MKRNNSMLWAAWLLLAVLAVFSRFHHLGIRAMSHDESLHAFYAWQYAEKGEYVHDPMMHGPLLFHLNAAVYRLIGASDWSSRIAPAAAGIFTVFILILFGRFTGPRAAWFCALLVTCSPDLYFYSRYIRNEAFIGLLLLVWIYALFRYLEKPQFRWMFLTSVAMSLSFSCKEVTFIHTSIIGSFLLWRAGHCAYCRQLDNAVASMDMILLTFCLPLPFSAPLLHHVIGWNPLDYSTPGGIAHTLMLGLLLLCSACGLILFWHLMRRRLSMGRYGILWPLGGCLILFWSLALPLFTSLFTNPVGGVCSGIAGSLGYWLAQHGVQRGSQPLYYYPMLLILYNPLLLVCAIPFFGVLFCRASQKRLPFKTPSDMFTLFSVWWGLGSLILYSAAGERMPWLLVHISLPLCFVAAIALDQFISRIQKTEEPFTLSAGAVLAVPFTLYYLLTHLPDTAFLSGRSLSAILNSMNWIRCGWAFVFLIGLFAITLYRKRFRIWRCYLPAGGLLLLFAFGLRNGLRHNNYTYDSPTEILVFAHASDMLSPLMKEITAIHHRQYNPKSPVVAYDQESAWPLTWYLHDFPHTFFTQPETNLLACPIILCGAANRPAVQRMTGNAYQEFIIPMIWWPLQNYMNQSPRSLLQILRSPERLKALWAIVDRREYPESLSAWPLRHDLFIFIRNTLASETWLRSTRRRDDTAALNEKIYGPYRPRTPDLILQGIYNGFPLTEPRAVTMLTEGGYAVADTGNNRIVLLNPDGSLLRTISPHPPLNAPWGLTVDDSGLLYISDTWNGKIRLFSMDGKESSQWGQFAFCADIRSEPEHLYGPRGLAWNSTLQQLAIADTGNKRILMYANTSRFYCAYGPFNEPVNPAFSEDGSILAVSDVWNRRIVLIDTRSGKSRLINALFWDYRNTSYKAAVVLDSHGFLYASVPDKSCVVKLDPQGKAIEYFGLPGKENHQLLEPSGLFFDHASGRLLVCDSGNGRILIYNDQEP